MPSVFFLFYGFYLFWLYWIFPVSQVLPCSTSLVVACRLSCPAACGILAPWPGIEPGSPALQGRFLTTGPPGKSLKWIILRAMKILQWFLYLFKFSSVQSLSCVQLFVTPWTAASQASLSITNSRSLLKLVHRVSDAIQPSHPLLMPSPPALNVSQHQGLFKWVSSLHQVAKVLEF